MFKKTACFLLAVLLLLTTTACQKTPDEGSSVPASSASDNVEGAGDSNGTSSGNPLQKADSIAYYKQGNATLKLGTVMSDGLLKALGTPTDTTEAPSCHYDGMDIIYTYDHISVYTY